MTNYVCRFPDGAAGVGLLLLRTCQALVAFGIAIPATFVEPYLRYPAAGVVAGLLLAGFATRLAAVAVGLAACIALLNAATSEPYLLAGHVGGCAGLALLGAGAFSVDARLHGRRVIHLQMRTPDRGGGD